ncbi:MAG: hypothetical protein GWP91_25945, partial [Rhodobacterales bacterium]|nr:hypothetical protein [Rhodobacterales bacterium]
HDAGAEIRLDQFRFPFARPTKYDLFVLATFGLNLAIPIGWWWTGAAPSWPLLVFAVSCAGLSYSSAQLKHLIAVTPHHVALEIWWRSRLLKRRVVSFEQIQSVEVRPWSVVGTIGRLIIHKTDGTEIGIFSHTESQTAHALSNLLNEIAHTKEDVAALAQLVPSELTSMQSKSGSD